MRRVVAQSFLTATLVACREPVHAYCRSRTDDPPVSACPDRCHEEGEPLHCPTRVIEYHFDGRGFPGMSQGELSDTFDAAFGRWANVTCDGTTLDLVFTPANEWTSIAEKLERARDDESGPRESIIAHLSEQVPTSTMYCNSAEGETLKRDLHQDDAAGLCAIYPPAEAIDIYRVRIEPNCSVMPRGLGGALTPTLTCLSLLAHRRSRAGNRRCAQGSST